jgi:hypothetical protein
LLLPGGLALQMASLIINGHGDPGTPHARREECLEIIDGMVGDGIAEPGEFWVIEHDNRGRVIGEPFSAPSGLEQVKRQPA